jgi:hypothetical protein
MTFLYHNFSSRFSRDRSFYFHGDLFIETKWCGCEFFCVLKIMLNTTNQSINLPDALIGKCFGQNADHMQLSQIIFMKNSQPHHFVCNDYMYIWRSVLPVEEAEVPGVKNRPSTSNWQTISHKISTGRHSVWRFSIMMSAPSFQGTDHLLQIDKRRCK